MKLRNIFRFFERQTQDNNISEKNRIQNIKLTHEFFDRIDNLLSWNEFKTKTILKQHIVDFTYQKEGVLVPELIAKKSAEDAFIRYKSCGFVDEWNNIREDLLEYLR